MSVCPAAREEEKSAADCKITAKRVQVVDMLLTWLPCVPLTLHGGESEGNCVLGLSERRSVGKTIN